MSENSTLAMITLDYELFFGEVSGTVRRCLIEPTEALLGLARRRACRMVFFVDAGMLFRMEQQYKTNKDVAGDFDLVRRQLSQIVADGHDIQLHIHPHWEDSRWNGTKWTMDTHRYRLHAFSLEDIKGIVTKYREALVDASGYTEICAYRAGGWALQPFEQLSIALKENGISIDSSVMPGMHLADAELGFDFRNAPHVGAWRFTEDPNVPVPNGEFLEIPISSTIAPLRTKLSSAISKRFGPAHHATFGDGYAVNARSTSHTIGKLRRLLVEEPTAVTLDGYKAVLLERAYREHRTRGLSTFVIIGHPKGLTPFAVERVEYFLRKYNPETVTFPQLNTILSVS